MTMLGLGTFRLSAGLLGAIIALSVSGMASPVITMKQVGVMPEMMSSVDVRAFVVSPDGEHVAYLQGAGSRQQVVVDDLVGPKYTKAAATPVQTQRMTINPDRPEMAPGYQVEQRYFAFTGQGSEVVYVAEKRGQQHIVVAKDGVHHEWPSLGHLHVPGLSPGGRFIYAIYQPTGGAASDTRLIVNGVVSPEGIYVPGQPQAIGFHEPDDGSPHYAFTGREEFVRDTRRIQQYRVYFDGVAGPAFQHVNLAGIPLRFIEYKGQPAVVYTVRKEGETGGRLVVHLADGKTEISAEGVVQGSIRFGTNGDSVGWLEADPPVRGQRTVPGQTMPIKVVINFEVRYTIDGTPREDQNLARTFHISPDGSRWAVSRYYQEGGPPFNYVTVDGEEGAEFSSIEQMKFSPDSSRFVYLATNSRSRFVVEGDEEYGPYSSVSPLAFSDSGQSLTWYGVDERGGTVYVNGESIVTDAAGAWSFPVSFLHGSEDLVAMVRKDQIAVLMVGDREFPVEGQTFEPPRFSDDGEHFSLFGEFVPQRGYTGSRYLIDGDPLPIDAEVSVGPSMWNGFTPTGDHFLTFAQITMQDPMRRQGGTLLVDGYHLGDLFDYSGDAARAAHFLPDGRFRFVAVRDDAITQFTVDLDAAEAFGRAREEAQAQMGARRLLKVGDPKKLISFDAAMILDGDVIYGTGQGGPLGMGVVYRVNTDGTGFTILHAFLGGGEHARLPTSLVLGKDGFLYGTTGQGSFHNRQPPVIAGLFRVGTDGEGYEVVRTYPYSNAFRKGFVLDAVTSHGKLLGRGPVPNVDRTGGDAVIMIDPDSGDLSTVYQVSTPVEDQIPIVKPYGPFENGGDGYFYGFEGRTVFRFNLEDKDPEVLHQFTGAPLDGDAVRDAPVFFGDWLYGMTKGGGENQLGTVYRMKRDGSSYDVVRHFGKDSKLMAIAAGEGGVWGHRHVQMTKNHRQIRMPVIDRIDVSDQEPRLVTSGGLAGKTWIGELESQPMYFGVLSDELLAVSLTPIPVPVMEPEQMGMDPVSSAESAQTALADMEK